MFVAQSQMIFELNVCVFETGAIIPSADAIDISFALISGIQQNSRVHVNFNEHKVVEIRKAPTGLRWSQMGCNQAINQEIKRRICRCKKNIRYEN